MKKVLIAMSHALTEAQKKDLTANGYEAVISQEFVKLGCNRLAPDLSAKDLKIIAEKIISEALFNDCEAIAMTGEPALTFFVWTLAKQNKLTILQSTTQRDTVEKVQNDGSVIKTQVFCHVQWREI